MLRRLWTDWRAQPKTPGLQRAHALFDDGEFAAAAQAFAAVLREAPSATAWVNLGYCKIMLRDFSDARSAFGHALVLHPELAVARAGLGDIALHQSNHALALRHYDAALSSDAGLALVHHNRAQSLFALGRVAEAWRESEWRYQTPDAKNLYPHQMSIPRWKGETRPGRLLVHWEQGYGDIIQHLRFLPMLDDRVEEYAFECPPPLLRLLARSLPAGKIVEASTQIAGGAPFLAYVPLLSLPYVLGIDAGALPNKPYLHGQTKQADSLREHWSQAESTRAGACLTGMVWRGSDFDPTRNAELRDFAVLATPGVRLVSLQKELGSSERDQLDTLNAVDASPLLVDFAATADAIAALDLVVTVDTAVAHLAGAMGKPVLLLLNEPCAVRWMVAGERTPWYPSMHLVRKRAEESWAGLLNQAATLISRTSFKTAQL